MHTMHIILAEREGQVKTVLTKLFLYLSSWKTNVLVLYVVWCDALCQIYVVSKYMQSRFFDLCKSAQLIEGFHEFYEEFKEDYTQGAS